MAISTRFVHVSSSLFRRMYLCKFPVDGRRVGHTHPPRLTRRKNSITSRGDVERGGYVYIPLGSHSVTMSTHSLNPERDSEVVSPFHNKRGAEAHQQGRSGGTNAEEREGERGGTGVVSLLGRANADEVEDVGVPRASAQPPPQANINKISTI
jgi:hypothetical protein